MHKYKYSYFMLLILLLILVNSCDNKSGVYKMNDNDLGNISILKDKRIYFGHQSVGNDIISGIEQIKKEKDGFEINIIDLNESIELPSTFFAHSNIGENENPNSKCDAFSTVLNNYGESFDIALMKFCYIDINRDSDVNEMFKYYKKTMDSLSTNYPNIKFLHLTSPLRSNPRGVGVWIREILGRQNNIKLDNIKRNEYNELIRQDFPEMEIFDLAEIQSTYPNGRRESFEQNGKNYYSLIEDYTYDGGHLSEIGSKWVASKMIYKLGTVIEPEPKE